MNSTTTQCKLETISAMRRQEDNNAYVKRDFLQEHVPLIDIDIDCRTKMCEWCYQVVKFCKFSRESVEIAMDFLDRFLLTPAGIPALQHRSVYQLASMTALYTSIKITERQAMNPAVVSALSQNTYTAKQVEQMEQTMLHALQWRMSPPTTVSFVRELLALIPDDVISEQIRKIVYDIAIVQTELTIADYKYIDIPASTIAYCALMNSFDSMNLDIKIIDHIQFILSQSIGLDVHNDTVRDIQSCLYETVATNNDDFQQKLCKSNNCRDESTRKDHSVRRESFADSPRRVSERICTVE